MAERIEKVAGHTPDLVQAHIDAIAELFPNVVTEVAVGAPGGGSGIRRAVDFDLLRQELADHLVEGPAERYRLDWPGKRESAFAANAPEAITLRPVREESVDFDSTQNLFIEGDNLQALKLLQDSYLGKVKLIYIDPPYNTGNDFIYDDDFAESTAEYLERSGQTDEEGGRLVANTENNGRFHSDWLSMMYPRLKLARNLLSDDGVLVISIDEAEHANLVRVACEVFGNEAHVGDIVWKNSSKNDQAFISMQHEYLAFFVRSKVANGGAWIEKKEGLDKIYAAFSNFRKEYGEDWEAIHEAAKAWYKQFPPSDPVFASKHYNRMDERGVYFADNISGPNDGQYVYDVLHPVTGETSKAPASGWRFPQDEMLRRIADGLIHFGSDHTTVPNNKTYLANTEYQSLTSIRFVDGRAASKRLQRLFGQKVFTNPKDEFFLRDIYRAVGVARTDIVLDMFAGSGSAMHAVLELNQAAGSDCRYIGLQLPEDLFESLKTAKGAAKKITQNAIDYLTARGLPANVAEICKERLRLIAPGLDSLATDVGFRTLRVDSTSYRDVRLTPDETEQTALEMLADNIKADRTPEDLLFEVMIDWGLELSLPIERVHVEGAELFLVEGNFLVGCFDHEVSDAVIRAIAERKPTYAVFRDSSFASDDAQINAKQIFTEVSPDTQLKVI